MKMTLANLVARSTFLSVSKGKKAKSPRQMFLSSLMSRVSGDRGDKLVQLFQSDSESDGDAFVKEMQSIAQEMLNAKREGKK